MDNTLRRTHRHTTSCFRLASGLAVLLAFPMSAAIAQGPAQQRFQSPKAAFKALVDALKADDHARLQAILGPESGDVVSSGDEVADRNAARRFVAVAKEKARLVKAGDGAMIVHIGKDDWTLPIPIVKDDTGWRFDTAAGKEELLNRRIGRNELHTIAVCYAYVDAQREYARQDRTGEGVRAYAQKFRSAPGKRDGLYWEASAQGEQSPMGPLVAVATSEGYTPAEAHAEPMPYHGYYFRILTAQGSHAPGGASSYIVDGHMTRGFALVAYPAHYGSSGIMTFIVNQVGVVFQKNLGEKTAEIAAAMKEYDPDDSWEPVGQ